MDNQENKKIDIKNLFSALDEEMRLKLSSKIDEIYHPTARGNESELNWIGLLRTYLPERYKIDSGFVVDCDGYISDQIDIIIYDRHFTPFIFRGGSTIYIPAEGVYAVFEVKPHFDKCNYDYAVDKLNSVRKLNRTSATFTHIKGNDKKELFDIVGGLLTKEMKSNQCFDSINGCDLSIILCLNCKIKIVNSTENIEIQYRSDPILAFFLLRLIEKLRHLGSVPALDVDEYIKAFKSIPSEPNIRTL